RSARNSILRLRSLLIDLSDGITFVNELQPPANAQLNDVNTQLQQRGADLINDINSQLNNLNTQRNSRLAILLARNSISRLRRRLVKLSNNLAHQPQPPQQQPQVPPQGNNQPVKQTIGGRLVNILRHLLNNNRINIQRHTLPETDAIIKELRKSLSPDATAPPRVERKGNIVDVAFNISVPAEKQGEVKEALLKDIREGRLVIKVQDAQGKEVVVPAENINIRFASIHFDINLPGECKAIKVGDKVLDIAAPAPVTYETLLADFCGKYLPVLEELLADPSRVNELDDLINHMDARFALSVLSKLRIPAIRYLEDEIEKGLNTEGVPDLFIKGLIALKVYAAGAADRLNTSLVGAGILTQEEADGADYRIWNLPFGELAIRIINARNDPEKSKKLPEDLKSLDAALLEAASRSRIKVGVLRIWAYVLGMENFIRESGLKAGKTAEAIEADVKAAKANLKVMITMNGQIEEDIKRDLIENKFFGLNPENFVLVMNNFDYGFTLKDGRFVKSHDKKHHTNYNHGYNLINANRSGKDATDKSYNTVYNGTLEKGGFVELTGKTGYQYVRERGAETIVLERINDLIPLLSDCAVDPRALALWLKVKAEGAECLNEVLNNPSGQKGGLAFGLDKDSPYSILIEGLGAKSMMVDAKLGEMNKKAPEETKGALKGIPYNRLYMIYDIAALERALASNNGVLPMSIKHKKGAISMEIPTGDITRLIKTVMFLRRADALIDREILGEDKNYKKGSSAGALIHDFKELKNLADALRIFVHVYSDIEAFARSHGVEIKAKIAEQKEAKEPQKTAPPDNIKQIGNAVFLTDASGINDFVATGITGINGHIGNKPYAPFVNDNLRIIQTVKTEPNNTIFIYFEKEFEGYLVFGPLNNDACYIYQMAVEPQRQGHHFGTIMFESLVKLCLERNINKIALHTSANPDNQKVLKFYRSLKDRIAQIERIEEVANEKGSIRIEYLLRQRGQELKKGVSSNTLATPRGDSFSKGAVVGLIAMLSMLPFVSGCSAGVAASAGSIVIWGIVGIITAISLYFIAWRVFFPMQWFRWRLKSSNVQTQISSAKKLIELGDKKAAVCLAEQIGFSTYGYDPTESILSFLKQYADKQAANILLDKTFLFRNYFEELVIILLRAGIQCNEIASVLGKELEQTHNSDSRIIIIKNLLLLGEAEGLKIIIHHIADLRQRILLRGELETKRSILIRDRVSLEEALGLRDLRSELSAIPMDTYIVEQRGQGIDAGYTWDEERLGPRSDFESEYNRLTAVIAEIERDSNLLRFKYEIEKIEDQLRDTKLLEKELLAIGLILDHAVREARKSSIDYERQLKELRGRLAKLPASVKEEVFGEDHPIYGPSVIGTETKLNPEYQDIEQKIDNLERELAKRKGVLEIVYNFITSSDASAPGINILSPEIDSIIKELRKSLSPDATVPPEGSSSKGAVVGIIGTLLMLPFVSGCSAGTASGIGIGAVLFAGIAISIAAYRIISARLASKLSAAKEAKEPQKRAPPEAGKDTSAKAVEAQAPVKVLASAPSSSTSGINYESLLASFCGKYLPVLEELLSDPSRANELDDLINHMNARLALRFLNKLKVPSILYLEDELKKSSDPEEAINSILSGENAIILFAAGQASRLAESLVKNGVITQEEADGPSYRMWNLNLWDVARRINQKNPTYQIPAQAKDIKLGVRHILAYLAGLEALLRAQGKTEDEIKQAKQNLKFVITVNNQIIEDVKADLIANNFFGLNPSNVMLVLNDFDYGFVIKDGKFVKSHDKKHFTNYNHGFNIIYASLKGLNVNGDAYNSVYNPVTKQFEALNEVTGYQYLRNRGAKTAIIHRMNDLILLEGDTSVDLDTLILWGRLHKEGANCLNEVLNNPSGQKGGLAFTTDDYGIYSFLIEGLAVKSMMVDGKMTEMNKKAPEETNGALKGIPYNRLYMVFDIEALEGALAANGGVLPMSIKHKKGAISPEIPTGDMTGLAGMNTLMFLRRNDALIDRGIIPSPKAKDGKPEYTTASGALIHDFKELKNLTEALGILTDVDSRSSQAVAAIESKLNEAKEAKEPQKTAPPAPAAVAVTAPAVAQPAASLVKPALEASINYENLLTSFCAKYLPIIEELLSDPSRANELDDLINHMNARLALRFLNKLKVPSILYLEDE
ncbi:MAG: GNAT family N-acetyltransferase, partial [Candidatus Omnitrophica bacterium]|nr:GNAT family N-acetyltransferase [Candidatus Omnitrophota bacterium]